MLPGKEFGDFSIVSSVSILPFLYRKMQNFDMLLLQILTKFIENLQTQAVFFFKLKKKKNCFAPIITNLLSYYQAHMLQNIVKLAELAWYPVKYRTLLLWYFAITKFYNILYFAFTVFCNYTKVWEEDHLSLISFCKYFEWI